MENLAPLIAVGTALAALIGGYVEFVLRRSLLPCVDFELTFLTLDSAPAEANLGEIAFVVRNVGPGVGYVTNITGRLRYRLHGESGMNTDRIEPLFKHSLPDSAQGPGPVEVPHTDETADSPRRRLLTGRTFELAKGQRNFIQPGVTQTYRKPVSLPADTRVIHLWGAFEYHIEAGAVSTLMARLFLPARPRQNSVVYTSRRTFRVGNGG